MPEISQDAFEILNPGVAHISSSELRSRSNSLGIYKKNSIQENTTTTTTTITKPINNNNNLKNNSNTNYSITAAAGNVANKKNIKSVASVNNTMDHQLQQHEQQQSQSMITGLSALDTISHSYKRALDHR